MKNKEIRQNNKANGIPDNYSNGLFFLDTMYGEPVYIRNVAQMPKAAPKTVEQKYSSRQIHNNIQDTSRDLYSLPNTLQSNPLSLTSILFYVVFGIIFTILFGFILIAVFGMNENFDIAYIVTHLFSPARQLILNICNSLNLLI